MTGWKSWPSPIATPRHHRHHDVRTWRPWRNASNTSTACDACRQNAPGSFERPSVAWTFQAENTKLKAPTVGSHEYLRMQALSRIYLDNIENIQSSWVTRPRNRSDALRHGANDLGRS